MEKRKLILIAGGTASGKSLVAQQLKDEYEVADKKVALVTLDNYYKTLEQLGVENHSEVNWDAPSTFDWERVLRDVETLLSGEPITIFQYNYGTGQYFPEPIVINPEEVIIFEGIYGLYHKLLRELASVLIYVDVDSDLRLIRRIKRDSEGRYAHNFNSEDFIKKWESVIKPMHNRFINPTKDYADIIVRNNKQLDVKEKSSLIDLLQTLVVK